MLEVKEMLPLADLFSARSAPTLLGPGFSELRQRAQARFCTQGLPTTRDEAWRFTDLKRFQQPFERAEAIELSPSDLAPYLLEDTQALFVFVNGQLDLKHSQFENLAPGFSVQSLAELAQSNLPVPQLGQLSETGDSFSALNTALFQDGLLLRTKPGADSDQPIQLIHVQANAARAGFSQTRLLLELGASSSCCLIETHVSFSADQPCFSNAVAEIHLGENARLIHHLVNLESTQSLHLGTAFVKLAADANYSGHTLLMEGGFSRRNLRIQLAGKGASCDLFGLYSGRDNQHQDLWIEIDHQVPRGTSRQYFKGLLDGQAHGVFCGKVIVQPNAQKTDAIQTNRNLLLSDSARIDSKPQLEIYADDVKCAHGSSTGALNEDALFYLQSRGLDPDAAREILVYAFAHEILDKISFRPLLVQTEMALRQRFARIDELGD